MLKIESKKIKNEAGSIASDLRDKDSLSESMQRRLISVTDRSLLDTDGAKEL